MIVVTIYHGVVMVVGGGGGGRVVGCSQPRSGREGACKPSTSLSRNRSVLNSAKKTYLIRVVVQRYCQEKMIVFCGQLEARFGRGLRFFNPSPSPPQNEQETAVTIATIILTPHVLCTWNHMPSCRAKLFCTWNHMHSCRAKLFSI